MGGREAGAPAYVDSVQYKVGAEGSNPGRCGVVRPAEEQVPYCLSKLFSLLNFKALVSTDESLVKRSSPIMAPKLLNNRSQCVVRRGRTRAGPYKPSFYASARDNQ